MRVDEKLLRHWNSKLKSSGLGVVQTSKPTDKEKGDQNRSKKKGLPEWAHWGPLGRKYGKGYRK